MERYRDHGGDRYNGYYQDPHRNPQYSNPPPPWPSNDQRPNFPGDHHYHRDLHQNQFHNYNQNFGPPFNPQPYPPPQHQQQLDRFPDHPPVPPSGSEQSDPFWSNAGGGYGSGRKRGFFPAPVASPDHPDGNLAKLYVANVPKTATADDVCSLFKEHGSIVEVILPLDKRTCERQGFCFVKYATSGEADRAIKELDNKHTFPGEPASIRVRYADADRDRHGPSPPVKIYINGLCKQASKREIEEIFSPYGIVEDIYLIRDDHGNSRGCGFVQYSRREMAVAAIKALNGVFTMRGCDQPLFVRFAHPKKLKAGEPRANYDSLPFQAPTMRPGPVPNLCNPMTGPVPPAVPYPVQQIPPNPQLQAFPPWPSTGGAPPNVIPQPHPPVQAPLQPTQFPLQQTQPPWDGPQPYQHPGPGMQKQIPPIPPPLQNFGQLQNSHGPKLEAPPTRSSQTSAASSPAPIVSKNPEAGTMLECDWSEHTCPDGDKYYYNCETRESRWDKPEEFALFEQQSQKQKKPQSSSQTLQSHSPVISTERVSQNQEVVVERVQVKSETSPLVNPTCV